MAERPCDEQPDAALDALRQLVDAVTEVAERMFGLPPGTVAR